MQPIVDVISIGQLSCNSFWGEQEQVRPAVATTSLVRTKDANILVDPSLPGPMMADALARRSGLKPGQINIVFLTSFHPTHRRGIDAFEEATWLVSEREREAVGKHLNGLMDTPDDYPAAEIEAELALLGRTEPAGDEIVPGVGLFPSPGVTDGTCGLLIAALRTIVIAGDAILTRDYCEHGRAWERASDAEQAAESLADILQIADIIVPGHDNLLVTGGVL